MPDSKAQEAFFTVPLNSQHNMEMPQWVFDFLSIPRKDSAPSWLTDAGIAHLDRMALVVELSHRNVQYGTGGPFAAAIFDDAEGSLIAVGVNRVEALSDATCHAEVMAIRMASARFARYDLSQMNLPLILYASAEPCCMCSAVIMWSGIRRVFFAADKSMVESIGFDEGPTLSRDALYRRGITFEQEVGENGALENAAQKVLRDYQASGGLIYNGLTERR